MATDQETGVDSGETALARPSFKITGLHIKGLKSIGSLDLPEDGLGWDGSIPDMVMVGGINGSGKTTLLEFLIGVLNLVEEYSSSGQLIQVPPKLLGTEAFVDFWCEMPGYGAFSIRFLVGSKDFIERHSDKHWLGLQYIDDRPVDQALMMSDYEPEFRLFMYYLKSNAQRADLLGSPAVVYFQSEGRTLISPETKYKFAGKFTERYELIYRWERPKSWDDSLEARLYSIRWEDLNAKEAGRPEDATHFRSYQLVFESFFEGRKQLRWTPKGELVVETKSGAIHDLSELSSGEKQVILFMGELMHRWRPGSLILIDEPELHLHEYYQTKLREALVHWQKERGGQVILATQSGHLFRIASSAMKVLLSRQSR